METIVLVIFSAVLVASFVFLAVRIFRDIQEYRKSKDAARRREEEAAEMDAVLDRAYRTMHMDAIKVAAVIEHGMQSERLMSGIRAIIYMLFLIALLLGFVGIGHLSKSLALMVAGMSATCVLACGIVFLRQDRAIDVFTWYQERRTKKLRGTLVGFLKFLDEDKPDGGDGGEQAGDDEPGDEDPRVPVGPRNPVRYL